MLDDFAIRPVEGGSFTVAPVVQELERSPSVVRLPAAKYAVRESPLLPDSVYVVCSSPVQAIRVKQTADSGGPIDPFIGSVAILEVAPDHVNVYQPAPIDVVQQVATFLLPLLRGQDWRVFTENGEETSHFIRNPRALFE